ncbi:MAG: ATP-binding protein [Candidatus Bathyarchaeia archaeon]
MPEEWVIGRRQASTVSDWKKLIQDFRDQFPYNPLTALIVESFSNSVDAKATRIDIYVKGDTYRIVDDGKGMSMQDFREYHNIASLTKRRGEGIGFAGAKVFLDRTEYVITETRSRSFNGATRWGFRGESLEWEPIPTSNRLPYFTGTYVEAKLKYDEDIDNMNANFIEKVLQIYFNAILLGFYNVRRVTINEKEVLPWKIPEEEIETRKDFELRYDNHTVKGFIVKSTKALPDEFQGPFIVVFGKAVMQSWFKQYPIQHNSFYGLILADHLIEILRTSKSDFERTSKLWRRFQAKIGQLLSDWLDEIGAKPKLLPVPSNLERMSRELEKTINDILSMPEFSSLANMIFQNIVRRTVAIKSVKGELVGLEVEGHQETTGTLGGPGEGKGLYTIGDEEGRGVVESESGSTPIERVRRRVRGGIKIGFDEQPINNHEGWLDLGNQVIIINTGHPAWKIAEGLSILGRAEHVMVYHILRTVLNVLVEEAGIEKETQAKEIQAKLLFQWYDSYIGGLV